MTIISKDILQLQSLGSYAFAVKVSRDEDGIAGHPNSIENPNWSVRQGTPVFCKGGRFFEIAALLRRPGLVSLSGEKVTLGVSR